MKVSLNWVKDYVKLPDDMDLKRLSYDLTMSTVEVEDATDLSESFRNMVVGVVPYIGLTLRHSVRPPMAWVICLIISMITFLGLVIFKGRILLAEFEKRLHL